MDDAHEAASEKVMAPWDRMFAFLCSEEFGRQFKGVATSWTLKWPERPELCTAFEVSLGGTARQKKSGEEGGVAFVSKLNKTRTSTYGTFANFMRAATKARTDEGATTPAVATLDDVQFIWSSQDTGKENSMTVGGMGRAFRNERVIQRAPAKMTELRDEYEEIANAILEANQTRLKNLARSSSRKANGAAASEGKEKAAPTPKTKKAASKEDAAPAKTQEGKKRKREEPAEKADDARPPKRVAAKKAAKKVKDAVAEPAAEKRIKTNGDKRAAMVTAFFRRHGEKMARHAAEMTAFADELERLGDDDVEMSDAEDAHVGGFEPDPNEASDSDSDPDAPGTAELGGDESDDGGDGEEDGGDEDEDAAYAGAKFNTDECNELEDKDAAEEDDSHSRGESRKVTDDDENTLCTAPKNALNAARKAASASLSKLLADDSDDENAKQAAPKQKKAPAATANKAPASAKKQAAEPAKTASAATSKTAPKKATAETATPKKQAPAPAQSPAPKKPAPQPAQKAPGATSSKPAPSKAPSKTNAPANADAGKKKEPALVMPSPLNADVMSMSDVIASANDDDVTVFDL